MMVAWGIASHRSNRLFTREHEDEIERVVNDIRTMEKYFKHSTDISKIVKKAMRDVYYREIQKGTERRRGELYKSIRVQFEGQNPHRGSIRTTNDNRKRRGTIGWIQRRGVVPFHQIMAYEHGTKKMLGAHVLSYMFDLDDGERLFREFIRLLKPSLDKTIRKNARRKRSGYVDDGERRYDYSRMTAKERAIFSYLDDA